MLEDQVRPTSIKHTFDDDNYPEIPACVVYGNATPGDVNKSTIHIVSDQCTRRPKGQQGVLVFGTLRSKFQHYKIAYRDMWKESDIVSRKGVVRTPDKWGFHAGHFSIVGFGIIQ